MADYPPKLVFKIFIIDRNTSSVGMRADRLTEFILVDTHNDFNNEGEAENWIYTEGEKYLTYTIMRVFKMQ